MRHIDNRPRATIDFESRSACSIRNCGTWRYSFDPTTEVLCLAFRLPYWEEGRTALWHPAFPHLGIEEDVSDGPIAAAAADALRQVGLIEEYKNFSNWDALTELFEWIMAGELVEAHNAWFERGVWVNHMQPLGWPRIQPTQWRCSAAKAASHALPRALEDAVDALALDVRKDEEGAKLMKKGMKPRKPNKSDYVAWNRLHAPCPSCSGVGKVQDYKKDGTPKTNLSKCAVCEGRGHTQALSSVPPLPLLYHESRESFERLWAYCRQDVLAEEALSHRLRDLNLNETDFYIMDQMVNERGFHLDMEAVDVALALIDLECVDLNAELRELTGGVVEKATQRAQMMDWFESQGLRLEDTQKETIEAILTGTSPDPTHQQLTAPVRRGLELMKVLGRSSTAKFVAMRNWVCPDSRVHGGLLYSGASTGRWTGVGVQPHNFVRGKIKDMEHAWVVLKTMDRERIQTEVVDKDGAPIGTVMDVLANALRGAITATPGHVLYVADYSSIEARVLLWAAGDDKALDIFRNHEDIYCYMASDIYGYPCNKKDHPDERGIGKIAVLGLGYQMGWSKFIDTAAKGGVTLTEDFAREIVDIYRTKFWRVKQLWYDQEAAAIDAVLNPRYAVVCGKVEWYCDDGFLYCQLPSGRCIAYPEPEMRQKRMPWGDLKDTLTFMGVNPFNHQWQRQHTYGGSLVENIVQAVARDLMAEAMWRCEQSGIYVPVLSVHDELIAEALEGTGDVKAFEQLMAACPDWADGLPVECEGFSAFRYRK